MAHFDAESWPPSATPEHPAEDAGGLGWRGEQRWSYSRRFEGNTSSAAEQSRESRASWECTDGWFGRHWRTRNRRSAGVAVNTGMKVHQHSEAKIHQFESRWLGGLVSGRGSARGINPLAAAKIKFGE